MTAEKSTELVVPVVDDANTYLAIKQDPAELATTIAANLGGEKLSAFDLDRIKIPTGGGKSWVVPTLEGEKLEQEIKGIIVANRLTRSYWESQDPDNSPPDCTSPDGIYGIGDPGNALRAEGKGCEDCPLSQWGSRDETDDDDNRQACKQQRQLFLLDPEEMLPFVISLPPTSLKNAKGFLQRLTSKAIPYWGVIVSIGLEGATSGGGQDYSKATFKVLERLDAETTAKVRAYADALAPVIAQQRTYDEGDAGGAVFDPDEQ